MVKTKWIVLVLIGFSCVLASMEIAFSTVVDRPVLFVDMLKHNESLSQSVVSLMNLYLENPETNDVAELKGLIRKMIGDEDRNYLSKLGFSVDDFIDSIDVIGNMPQVDRLSLLKALTEKAYDKVLVSMSQYDHAVVIGGKGVTRSDGSGEQISMIDAKKSFEKRLQDSIELLSAKPVEYIPQGEFVKLLNVYFDQSMTSNSSSDVAPIERVDAMQLIFSALPLESCPNETKMKCSFKDIQDLNANQRHCIEVLVSKRVISGYTDDMLKPNQFLTYGEAWTMIRKALDVFSL